MWVDVLAAATVAVLAGLGFWRGTLATFLGLFCLLGAYALGFLLGPSLGPPIARALGVSSWLALPVGASAVFTGTYLVLSAAAYVLRRRDEREREGRTLSDRLGGAGLGLAQGSLVLVLFGVLAAWLDAGRNLAHMNAIPDTRGAWVSQLSRSVLQTAGTAVIRNEDAGARIALRLATQPTETLQAAQTLFARKEIQDLQEDSLFWAYVENDQVDKALNSRAFLQLSYRREIREQLADLGMVDPRGVDDTTVFRNEARERLAQLGPHLRALHNDPELAELVRDPEISQAVQERNIGALLANPRVRALVDRVMAAPPPAPQP